MERGWVGRVDGDRVVHLAAQTLQSYFLGGGGAREHAEYARSEVVFLPPVLHPPTVRVFDAEDAFAFTNAAAVVGPGAVVPAGGALELLPRVAAVVGAEGAIGGFSLFGEWRNPTRSAPKDRDFALALGPFVVTPETFASASSALSATVDGELAWKGPLPEVDWERARAFAADGTTLRPGDLLAGPAAATVEVPAGASVELSAGLLGKLPLSVGPAA